MILKTNERCPIHGRLACCGREPEKNSQHRKLWVQIAPGVSRIPDEHHPRGYRIRRSKSAMRTLVLRKVREQNGLCFVCKKPFLDIADVTPEHIEPRGLGGAWRDDDESNIAASHGLCNSEKGSKRGYEKTSPQTEGHEGHQGEAAEGERDLGVRDEAGD